MAREGDSVVRAHTAPQPDSPTKPDNPTDLTKPSLVYTVKRAAAEFGRDQCTDLAAGLTYYSVLSIFPALLALVSVLGVFGEGESSVNAILDMLERIGQGDAAENLRGPISSLAESDAAGVALIGGIAGALWSASNYVNAFGRALNKVYEIDEGRPFWKLRPQMLLVTIIVLALAATILLGLVVSGPVAASIGQLVGLEDSTVMVWNLAKWPVILLLVIIAVAVLYYGTPNVKQPKFRWVSVGAAVAILIWILASLAFGWYVSGFASYNKTYGSLAGVIVFLLWLWLTNLALLFGAEIDSEMERARQLQAGIAAETELQLPPRDTAKSEKAAEKYASFVQEGRQLREQADEAGYADPPGADVTGGPDAGDGPGPGGSGPSGRPAFEPVAPGELEPLPSSLARQRGYDRRPAR